MTQQLTKAQTAAADIAAILRARNPVIQVVTREEARVEPYLFEACASAGYVARTWDVAAGACDIAGNPVAMGDRDPGDMLGAILSRSRIGAGGERSAWIMRDLPIWLQGAAGAATLRTLCNIARARPTMNKESAQAVIILSPSAEIPPELSNHCTVVEWPMPDRAEIEAILDAQIEAMPEDLRASAAPNGQRAAAIDAAVGLTGEEAAACYARSLVQLRRIDPATVSREKKRVISRERVLEWIDPIPGGLDSIGGLENLKAWLMARSSAYSPAAREYGLPAPKGILLVGVPGCGKSHCAKSVPTAWQSPCLRADLGGLKSKYVGSSEANLRNMFRVADALGRSVLWIDEIEKALGGATQGAADGGVSADALGALLSWMQDRTSETFVIATCNDVESLPPELLRKGRFDEVFWVDLPNATERAEILRVALRANKRTAEVRPEAMAQLVKATDGFTGSEIAALVPDAMFSAFSDGAREITTADLMQAAGTVVPLSKTAAEKITKLRNWAAGRARPASKPDTTETSARPALRALDL